MLENRKMTMRLFPELFGAHKVAPVDHYPDLLLETLRESSPATTAEPTVVVLTPGMHNSAYFEHAFLARFLDRVNDLGSHISRDFLMPRDELLRWLRQSSSSTAAR